MVGITIDGLEVQAPENAMLVDGAKYGDVEIPVFCYEPKLGQPVGACRMCLVEIEGIPKLQTGVLHPGQGRHGGLHADRPGARGPAGGGRVPARQPPARLPRVRQGRRVPAAGHHARLGPGTSRFIEPKRHFRKPLALSPLVAIDRERCILCYRCVRFSQEVAEDYQLVLLERGAHTFVGTFDGHPYVAPFSGNIIELCPVGALTSLPYRFRARPWDIEDAGSVCTLCPSQCNVTFTVRDERVMRVLARDNADVDDGWLCDKGRFAYQSIHVDERIVEPLVRDGGELRPVSWERALEAAARALLRARRARGGARRRRRRRTRRASCSSACCARGSTPATSTRRPGADLPLELARALGAPALQATRPRPRVRRTPCWCSTASRSTRRRSSTCGCARACAATHAAGRRRGPPERARPNARALAAVRARRRRGVPRRARCRARGRGRRRAARPPRRAAGDLRRLATL